MFEKQPQTENEQTRLFSKLNLRDVQRVIEEEQEVNDVTLTLHLSRVRDALQADNETSRRIREAIIMRLSDSDIQPKPRYFNLFKYCRKSKRVATLSSFDTSVILEITKFDQHDLFKYIRKRECSACVYIGEENRHLNPSRLYLTYYDDDTLYYRLAIDNFDICELCTIL